MHDSNLQQIIHYQNLSLLWHTRYRSQFIHNCPRMGIYNCCVIFALWVARKITIIFDIISLHHNAFITETSHQHNSIWPRLWRAIHLFVVAMQWWKWLIIHFSVRSRANERNVVNNFFLHATRSKLSDKIVKIAWKFLSFKTKVKNYNLDRFVSRQQCYERQF